MTPRSAEVTRQTAETDIQARLTLDGAGRVEVQTGVGFFDHMLRAAMVHGFFDLTLTARGDTEVDDHHTVEDVGIVLGQAFSRALGDFSGIRRFGQADVPMDGSLARAVVDFSRRPCLVYDAPPMPAKIGRFDTELVREFWQGFAQHAGVTLHLDILRGDNAHHMVEALFKAGGRALDMATQIEPRAAGVISTKGVL